MVMMGAEEQIVDDPQRALDQYAAGVPGAETELIAGAGHSPNVEKPAETADLSSDLPALNKASPAALSCNSTLQNRSCRPKTSVAYEPMFDSSKH